MSIHTVSLETAKLLKGAGFRQDTHFTHCLRWGRWQLVDRIDKFEGHEMYSAPTTDELLSELPWHTQIYKGTDGNLGQYICHLDARSVIGQKETKWFYHGNLCEAIAQMWLHLKKEGLLNETK